MITKLSDWLDTRLGHRAFLSALGKRVLPTGPSWWLTSASCLFWLLVIQCVTGLLLMASYSPSMASAWASVHFIDQTAAGRFLRGIHHFTSHAMIILIVVHVARVLITGAFRAPRELVWITGLLLIPLIIVWTVTGNPLAGSQKGFAQIEVEGNIIGSTPVIGKVLQRILIGGDEVGNLTLTHLHFLHVGLLPVLVVMLAAVHLHQVFRHGVVSGTDAPLTSPRAATYWPYQTVRNQVVLALVVASIGGCAWYYGAPLDAPADAGLPYAPRPEWYFRWIFELRRHFSGDWEFVATMIVPAAILGFFMAVPLVDRALPKWLGFLFRATAMLTGLAAWSVLTWTSYSRDWNNAEFLADNREFQELSERARLLADTWQVSTQGAQQLLGSDARTQGPLLFRKHCASCHSHADAQGEGIVSAEPSAPNLFGFGTSDWIGGLLDGKRIATNQFFGHTKFREGEMVAKVNEMFENAEADGEAELRANLQNVARALSAEAALTHPQAGDQIAAAEIARGRELLTGDLSCTDCHRFGDKGELGTAPDLTGYGSREWLLGMISNPTSERFYSGDNNDRMPSFAPDTGHPQANLLTPDELKLLVDWLRGEWYDPPVTAHVQPAEKKGI